MKHEVDRFEKIAKRVTKDAKGDAIKTLQLFRLYFSREGQFKQEQKQLEKQYQWVCKNVFPDWKNSKDWVVAVQRGDVARTAPARIHLLERIIDVHHCFLDVDESGLLEYPVTVRNYLIHEICHAINEEQGVWHDHKGAGFQSEMLSAFRRVVQLEDEKTPYQFWGKHREKLSEEAFWFRDPDMYETYEDFESEVQDDYFDTLLSQAIYQNAMQYLDDSLELSEAWTERYNDFSDDMEAH